MTEAKTKKNSGSVKTFVDNISDPGRQKDCKTVMTLLKAATGKLPTMWGTSIIGYGVYEQTYAGGKTAEWPLIGVSPRKNDLTIYIMPGFNEEYQPLLERLGKHKIGKSCLYIKSVDDLHLPTLKKLINASVKDMKKKYKTR